MNPNEKLEFVKEQILAIQKDGKEHPISCPYCLSVVPVGEGPCCNTLWNAVSAIMEAQAMFEKVDFANKILERAAAN